MTLDEFVYVLDDDPDLAGSVARLLRRHGLHAEPFNDSVALLEAYPTGTLLLVVDNASYHTSHAVVDWLKQHDRLLLLYLPARSPDLNPVEKIWDGLKEAVSANRSFADLKPLLQFIEAHFKALTPARALQLAGVRRDF